MIQIISVNVGLPREVEWKGQIVRTGIFKEPVAGRVAIYTLNLAGDQQADLTVHGGTEKAVYAYPAEHYTYWQQELPDMDLPWGMFGENLTTQGLQENTVNIGDRFQVGTAVLQATQPRLPCYKLSLKFNREDIVKRFLHSKRYGIYFAVVQEGSVAAGDTIKRIYHDPNSISVPDIVRLYVEDKQNLALMQRALALAALPENWRSYFRQCLDQHQF